MRFLKSKSSAVIILVCISILFAILMTAAGIFNKNQEFYYNPPTIIDGVYSIDDGPWIETDLKKPIEERFSRIVFKGRLIRAAVLMDELDISIKNAWVTLRTADGGLIYSNAYRIKDSEAWNVMMAGIDPEDAVQTEKDLRESMPLAMHMPQTPGYEHISFVPSQDVPDYTNAELVLTIENPYRTHYAYPNYVAFTLSEGNGAYLRASREWLLPSVLFLLICFLGIFLFPTISFIFGSIHYRYLTFGLLCFFGGSFMLLYFQSRTLNTFINDPVLCMTIERMALHFFFVSMILYCRANLKRDLSRTVSGAAALIYLLGALAALVLHLMAIVDLTATMPVFHAMMGLIILLLVFLLTREALSDKTTLWYLLSWTPMLLTLFLDVVDQFLQFPGDDYFIFGFGLTLTGQIVQLVFDLQRQYKEAVHYHQIQKELYEARVSIMTSQIRPHFMYNALTSIAMMCTIDPPTAQEATVTFAKYLRENMDSLKQNKPVPFAQELDHLKKYLYIEKLRFQDKLNIEYQITATDFVLPLLSVQPLVENAVKHGVGMKKKGGTVTIGTRETEDAFEVIISDDGVGFDTTAAKADDGRSHVGMENTRTRLKEMCSGEIRIESTPGEGTTATIILPKEGQIGNENTVSG